jgi:hypothetical protein
MKTIFFLNITASFSFNANFPFHFNFKPMSKRSKRDGGREKLFDSTLMPSSGSQKSSFVFSATSSQHKI